MKPVYIILFLIFSSTVPGISQSEVDKTKPKWSEEDRTYLLQNLTNSIEELQKETKNLSAKQWNFKANADRWSINQIVEHLAIWELLFVHEISVSLRVGPIPNFPKQLPDSLFLNQDPESLKPKNALDYTKPFSYTIPSGENDGEYNLNWITNMREESIEFLKNDTRDLRAHYINFGPNIHQNFLMIFTHTFRHLKQIKRVKEHPDYPE